MGFFVAIWLIIMIIIKGVQLVYWCIRGVRTTASYTELIETKRCSTGERINTYNLRIDGEQPTDIKYRVLVGANESKTKPDIRLNEKFDVYWNGPNCDMHTASEVKAMKIDVLMCAISLIGIVAFLFVTMMASTSLWGQHIWMFAICASQVGFSLYRLMKSDEPIENNKYEIHKLIVGSIAGIGAIISLLQYL